MSVSTQGIESPTDPANEERMTEFRRLKMKFGEAEFEADVPEHKVQSMYAQFLFLLERRNQPSGRLSATDFRSDALKPDIEQPAAAVPAAAVNSSRSEAFDEVLLSHVFDLREDGTVTLKVLPTGPDKNADAMLLLLYGYHRLKNEEYVLATHLFRAAEQSGVLLRRLANEYMRNGRFVVRGGRRKGSHYSLNDQGIVMAREIAARMIGSPGTFATAAVEPILSGEPAEGSKTPDPRPVVQDPCFKTRDEAF